MAVKSINTRFRAYQLDSAGSSFSYSNGSEFTLIEARYTDANKGSIADEMRISGKTTISTLHITSWDQDHCSPSQLEEILSNLKPRKIEYPGYVPHTTSGIDSLRIIKNYKVSPAGASKLVSVTPEYINRLDKASSYGYKDILYRPKIIDLDCANDNSTVKQFRSGSFNVLSLGDVESPNIASMLRATRSIYSEVDIMIMAHHGADNGFTTSSFIKKVRPSAAVASSNYGNQFDHPKPEIRDLLHKNGVRLFTTKTGDLIVRSLGTHKGKYEVINLKAGSSEVSSKWTGLAKKRQYLQYNPDTLRDRGRKHYRGPQR
ncbi:MAG: hypothetical protein DRR42_01650 [Gammaproteobacteria bacterium]|nr:MAG: hypothetical protein DRR42_01650 [Gammaproteobacteria bacterium]